MPSCAVVGCKNSSRKKVKMCYIPREERIRQEWITRINRNNWVPSGTSAICQYHFEPHMWEKPREDGKLKLKYGAIPTIFGSRVFQVGNSQLLDGNGENINELLDGADNPSGIRDVEAHENNYDDEQCPTVVSTAVPNQGKRLLPDLPGDQIPQNQRILTQISTNAQSSHHSLNNNSVTNDNNSWSKSPDDETISDHSKSPEDETEKLEQPQQCNGILQQVSDAASSSSVECQPTTAQSSDQFDDDENFIKTCDIWSFINPGGNDDVDQNINSVAACSASVRDDVQNFEQHNSSGSFNETSHDDDVLQSSAENVTMDVLNNDCDSDEMACDTDDEDSSILQTAQPQHSPSKEELLERMKRMEKVYLKSKRMNSILKTRLRENRKTIKRLEKKILEGSAQLHQLVRSSLKH